MSTAPIVFVTGAVEGSVDAAVLTRIVEHVGAKSGPIHGNNGKQALLRDLHGYNEAARFNPWLVLIDLNTSANCAPEYRASALPAPTRLMCFRVAVRAIEAWLLADREGLAKFLSVAKSRIPADPEAVENPKEMMVNIARRSQRASTRDLMVPRDGSGRVVGSGYTSEMIHFITDRDAGWRPEVAAQLSASLARALECVHMLVAELLLQNGPG